MSCTCAWAQPVSIVPQPAHIEQQNGSLTLRADMTMAYSADCQPQAEYLRKAILGATAYNWSTAKKKSRADVVLEIDARRVTAAEGYNLTVDRRGITICAHDNGGLFYGIQTLLQLLPPARLRFSDSFSKSSVLPVQCRFLFLAEKSVCAVGKAAV